MYKESTKEDIYRLKRKMYMAASMARGGIKEGYLNPDIAENVLEIYKSIKDSDNIQIPSGKEFLSMPPTAAGRKYFASSLAALMCSRDRFLDNEYLTKNGITAGLDPLFFDGLSDAARVIDKVLSDYFTASGITPGGEHIEDKAVRKKGREDFLKSRQLYETTIQKTLTDYGVRIIKKLGEDADFKPSESPAFDTVFERMVDADPLAELLYEDVVRHLRGVTERAVAEAAGYRASVLVFKEKFFPKFYSKDTDPVSRDILKAAFLEYRNYVEMRLLGLADIRESCLYYGRCVLQSEPVDRIMYEKILKCINMEAEFMSDDILLDNLPGYEVYKRKKMEEIEAPSDLKNIQNMTKNLRKYYDIHPFQFDGQCLRSAIDDVRGLGLTLSKAEVLSGAIEDFSRSKAAHDLVADEWFDLLDCWVFSECIVRVGYPIIDFINEHHGASVGQATDDFRTLLPYISYASCERTVRFALREVIIERSGLNV